MSATDPTTKKRAAGTVSDAKLQLIIQLCKRILKKNLRMKLINANFTGSNNKDMATTRKDINSIQDFKEEELYAYLCKAHPEGLEQMGDEEQETLMALLRKKSHSI